MAQLGLILRVLDALALSLEAAPSDDARGAGEGETVPAASAEAAAVPEAAALKRLLPSQFVDLVSERAQRCQALLRSA